LSSRTSIKVIWIGFLWPQSFISPFCYTRVIDNLVLAKFSACGKVAQTDFCETYKKNVHPAESGRIMKATLVPLHTE
jgi:hypothetical protein